MPASQTRHAGSAEFPFVSVVMPIRNAAATLEAAVRPLLDGDYPAERLEILIVDGESEDGSRKRAKALADDDDLGRIRILSNPDRRTPVGLNLGIEAARGEIVVRMDGHARPEADYVSACVKALSRSDVACVGGRMVGFGETAFGKAVALAQSHPFGAGDAAFRLAGRGGPVDTVYMGAWRIETLRELGGFDPAWTRNQDYELALRIREAGGTVWLDPAIRSRTLTRGSPGALARQYVGYGRGRAATWRRHPGSLRLRQALPALFVLGLLFGLVLSTVFGLVAVLTRLAMVAYGLLILWAWLGLLRRAEGWARLWLPCVFPIMHLAWGAGFWVGLLTGWRRKA